MRRSFIATILLASCNGEIDDLIELDVEPPPFFLGPDDDAVALELAACLDGGRGAFTGSPVFIRMTITSRVRATIETPLSIELGSPPDLRDAVDKVARDEIVDERALNFPILEFTEKQSCTDWGTYRLSRMDPAVESRVDVDWDVRLATEAPLHELELFVR